MASRLDPFDIWPDAPPAEPGAPPLNFEQFPWPAPPRCEEGWREGAEQLAHRPEQPDILQLLDVTAFDERDPPRREWALEGFIPWRQATLLTGPGSSGKSLFGQQLVTCAASAKPFMSFMTRPTSALYVTCEDDRDELERRQKAICRALDVDCSSIAKQLHLSSLQGEIDNELVRFSSTGMLMPTKAFRRLEYTALALQAGLVVLDNTAHFFSGNENSRYEVAAFMNVLNRLALRIGGSVLLIGHPNKAGAEFSGSTAWENQVRSRLFLKIENAGIDPDARTLTTSKANYARTGRQLKFRWVDGAFVSDEELAPDVLRQLQEAAEATAANEAYLRCLAKATADQQAVSHHPGCNYAPTIFSKMVEGKGFTKDAFERAHYRLLHLGRIVLDQRLWQRDNRCWKRGIATAESCTDPHAPTPSTDLHQSPRTDPHAPTPTELRSAGRTAAPGTVLPERDYAEDPPSPIVRRPT